MYGLVLLCARIMMRSPSILIQRQSVHAKVKLKKKNPTTKLYLRRWRRWRRWSPMRKRKKKISEMSKILAHRCLAFNVCIRFAIYFACAFRCFVCFFCTLLIFRMLTCKMDAVRTRACVYVCVCDRLFFFVSMLSALFLSLSIYCASFFLAIPIIVFFFRFSLAMCTNQYTFVCR